MSLVSDVNEEELKQQKQNFDRNRETLTEIVNKIYLKLFSKEPSQEEVDKVFSKDSKSENVYQKYLSELQKKMLMFWKINGRWEFPEKDEHGHLLELKDHLNKMRILQYTVFCYDLIDFKHLLLAINHAYYDPDIRLAREKRKKMLDSLVKLNKFVISNTDYKNNANGKRLVELFSISGFEFITYDPFNFKEKNVLDIILHIKKFYIDEQNSNNSSLKEMLSAAYSELINNFDFTREIETNILGMENNNFNFVIKPNNMVVYELIENPAKNPTGGRKIRSMRRRSPLNKTRRHNHDKSSRRRHNLTTRRHQGRRRCH